MSDGHVRAQVLVVDDERDHAEAMAEALRKPWHVCTIVHSRAAAKDELLHGHFDVIVTDLVMETETAGLDVLALARAEQPHAETIMVTAHGDIPTAKRALQGGAYDFIEKPVDLVVLRNIVHRAAETVMLRSQNESLKGQVDAAFGFEGIIGESAAMRAVAQMVRQLAPSTLPVLVTGESGTGKELVASAIHKLSKRASRRYLTFNAAGQAESLLEDQLFGHVRGAFTGATRGGSAGKFELADGGTIFLDEIGDMAFDAQVSLLRVLQEGEVTRVGAKNSRRVDVRIIAATHRNLSQAVAEGAFREDLYYRLNVLNLTVPPLRMRREDIPLLARIAALADVFDALTTERPYKHAWTVEAAVSHIEALAGSHFDPNLLGPFKTALPEMLRIREQFADSHGALDDVDGVALPVSA